VVLLLVCTSLASGQHLGPREQWQPQVVEGGLDPDRRLEQPVETEIIGRAAVPALRLLSEKTGVSLVVAPEDVDTVGERKLTVIAQGCTLKTLMVQIPQALRECHWDTDRTGAQPLYLLHQNANVEAAVQAETQALSARAEEARRPRRRARLEEARRALTMSDRELAELEKSDPFLAISIRDSIRRAAIQAFLSLPPEKMDSFLNTGHVELAYRDAAPEVQQSTRQLLERLLGQLEAMAAESAWPEGVSAEEFRDSIRTGRGYLGNLGGSRLWYRDAPSLGIMLHGDWGGDVIIPAQYPRSSRPGSLHYMVLTDAGESGDEARRITSEWMLRGAQAREKAEQRRRATEWKEPDCPELRAMFSLEQHREATLTELQQAIAQLTGLSVIADWFTEGPVYEGIPLQDRGEQPIWRALYVLAEAGYFEWKLVGDCLVFHYRGWHEMAHRELPERLIEAYRERLRARGRFTLDDAAELAVALSKRPMPRGRFALPGDLREAGLGPAVAGWGRWGLLFWASLSAAQRERARTAEGLGLEVMTPEQRREALGVLTAYGQPPGAQPAAVSFHVAESAEEQAGKRLTQFDLQLRAPDLSEPPYRLTVRLPEVSPPDRPSAGEPQ